MKETLSNEQGPELAEDTRFFRNLLNLTAGLARTPRWRESGDKPFVSSEEFKSRLETDMEHVGAMQVILNAIFDKAEAEGDQSITDLNFRDVHRMINLHDAPELITGDSRQKDGAFKLKEQQAEEQLIAEAKKTNIGDRVARTFKEYNDKETAEARFVKAIDELQSWIYMIATRTPERSKYTLDDTHQSAAGYRYAQEFPTLERIFKIALAGMKHPKLYTETAPEMEGTD